MLQTLRITIILGLYFLLAFPSQSQTIIYSETFTGQNGKGAVGTGTSISIDTAGVTWSVDTTNVTLSDAGDYMKVVNDSMEFSDVDGPGRWSSPSISISNFNNLKLSMYLSEEGTQSALDSVSVFYQIDGGALVKVFKTTDNFTSKTLTDTALAGAGSTIIIHVFMRNTAGTRFHRIDDVILKGSSTLDANSNISGINQTSYSSTISSLYDTDGEAVSVLSFSVIDSGTTDALATKITNIRVEPGTGNTADWTDHIQGVKLHDGSGFLTIGSPTITDTYIDIPITSGNMDVTNNSTKSYTMYAYLNTANIVDSAHLVFKIDPTSHGFTTDVNGSSLKSTVNSGTTINSGVHSLYVIAEEIKWQTQPANSTINVFMATQPVVELVDVNGNRDLDFGNYPVKIISTGTLSSDTISEYVLNGLATFDSLKHTVSGTSLKLTAICNNLTVSANVTDTIVSLPFDVGGQEGISISQNNVLYTIDFDNTVDGINNGAFNGGGLATNPVAGQLNSNGISILGMSDGDLAFGASGTTGDYARGSSSGGVSTGGIYAFQTSAGNYSLGFQPGGSDFTPGSAIIKLQNNTGDTIKEFLLSYHLYVYNDQGYATKGVVSYSTNGSQYARIDSAYSDAVADGSPTWRKHGFSNFNQNLMIQNGAYFYLKFEFNDSSGSGSRDEMAIDDIRLISYKNNKTLVTAGQIEGNYNTLNINGNGSTVSATGNVQVFNQLKLNNGLVNLNNFRMTLGSSSSDVVLSGGSASSYIYGGPLRMHINSNTGNYLFPIGANANNYSLVNIDFTSSTLAAGSYIDAEASEGKHPQYDANVSIYLNRYYTVTSSGISNPIYNIDLHYADSDVIGDESSLYPVKYSGASWQRPSNSTTIGTDTVGQGAVDVGNNKLTWTGVDGFSIFSGAGNGTPLPIELKSFGGKKLTQGNYLKWETSSEINSDYFELQRKSNDYFATVALINAAGSSNKTQGYSYLDQSVLRSEPAYYRLKMVDHDGSFEYSTTLLLSNESSDALHPKPTHFWQGNNLVFRGFEPGNYQISISDISGKISWESEVELGELETNLDFQEILPGAYFIVLKKEGYFCEVIKVMR
ncbi:MAG: hypothetical protein KDC83_06375 [Flavobacteriales bacterium]|nr:hypothetical protein [Flavobacteriales bacterium]